MNLGFPPLPGVPQSGMPFFTKPGRSRLSQPCPAPPPLPPRQVAAGSTIRLGADRAAPGLAALAVVRAVLVQGALLHTVRNGFELGAHAGFLCSGALGWVGAENCQEEPIPVSPTYPLPAPRSPNFNPKDFGFSGPGAAITSSQRTSSPGQGSLILESSLMLGLRAPSPLLLSFCLEAIQGASRSSSSGLCFQRRESLRPSNFEPSLVSPTPVHWTPDLKFQGSLAVSPRAAKF